MELDYPNYEVVLVDNASSDDSLTFTRARFPEVKIMANKDNLGFSSGMNVALRQIQSDVVVLLNNDVVVRPEWLRALIRPLLVDETIGITGCKLLYPDEQTIQHAGARLSYPLAYTHHHHYQETDAGQDKEIREVEYVTGAAMDIDGRVLDDGG
jgi:GT2 family glycosyltransferase